MVARIGLIAALALSACQGKGCSSSAEKSLDCRGCNLIFVSLTNVRKDHIGIYGYARNTTPHIDRFFENGAIFESFFSPASWTLPVAASLYTSTFPYTHGVMTRYQQSKLDDAHLTLGEILRDAGYTVAAFTGGGDYSHKFNLGQGFHLYVDESNLHALTGDELNRTVDHPMRYLNVSQLSGSVHEWLKQNHKRRFFLHVQGYDAHCPFVPRAPFDTRFDPDYSGDVDFTQCLWTFGAVEPQMKDGRNIWRVKTNYQQGGFREVDLDERDIHQLIARYDGEIAAADTEVGAILQTVSELGLLDNTIVVFFAEHGDLFGEHGRFMRGGPLRGTFYQPVLNPPLAIRMPRSSPMRSEALVQTVDLMPTLLELLEIEDPQRAQREGKSFVSLFEQPNTTINEHAFAGSRFTACNNAFVSGGSVIEAVRSQRYKLIREARYDAQTAEQTHLSKELYDLNSDSTEEKDLYQQQPAIAKTLEEKLRERFGPIVQPTPCPPRPRY